MQKYTVSENYTIKEVMMSFEENNERAAVVLGVQDTVVGIISQGDIIRALVLGVGILTPIRQIIKPSFFFLSQINYEKAYKIFKEKKISLLPVIDSDSRLVSIITINDIFDYLERR